MNNKYLEILKKIKNQRNIFVGFYGGGNYGDELLMEVLMNYNEIQEIQGRFLYLGRVDYHKFHHAFTFSKYFSKFQFLKESLISKNIVFGGGGIFSEDSSKLNLYLLAYLTFLKKILRKNIFLIGIGIYKETPSLSLVLRFLRIISPDIYVRDISSFELLASGQVNSTLDNDLSLIIKDLDVIKNYNSTCLLDIIGSDKKLIIFSYRKSNQDKGDNFTKVISQVIKENASLYNFVFWEMQEGMISPPLCHIKGVLKNTNPLDIFSQVNYLKNIHGSNIKIITPQFHGIITGYLLGIEVFPIFYADKGKDLLNQLGKNSIKTSDVRYEDLISFIKL